MQLSNEPFDAKVNTLNQHITTVKREIASMNDAMRVIKWELEEERKKKTHARAMEVTHLTLFEYFTGASVQYGDLVQQSSYLVKDAIQWSLLDHVYNIPARAAMGKKGGIGADKKAFWGSLQSKSKS